MKKFLSIALTIILALCLAACGTETTSTPDQASSKQTDSAEFVKPETYASVVLITINPQFKLYLDATGEVLAVEPVNDDAKSVIKDINVSTGNLKTVMKELVTATNKGGFAKENATVQVEITEIKVETVDTNAILSEAKTTVNNSFQELQITVTVETSVADDATEETSSATVVSSNPDVSATASITASEKASVSSAKHTHTFADATCTKPKTCACSATSGKALGHNYKEGACTRCKAKDKNYVPSYTSLQAKGGVWNMMVLNKNELFDVSFTFYKTGDSGYGCGYGIGDPFSGLPEDMRSDPEILEYSKKYEGEYYYFGRGDGDSLKSVSESGTTITVTDNEGNKLTLLRTSETEMKVTSCSASFMEFGKVPAGTILKYMVVNNNE